MVSLQYILLAITTKQETTNLQTWKLTVRNGLGETGQRITHILPYKGLVR